MKRLACVALLATVAFAARPVAERIEALIDSSRSAVQAFWGIRVVNLANGSVIYSKNDDHFFAPASNTKLFSTALALTRLGPDFRFHTSITTGSEPDANGVIHGDMRLIGGGDPNLSARILPYKRDEFGDNPVQALDEMAAQLVARGVRRVDGDVIGDDTRYVWEPYPDGWSADDAIWEYGAAVSALTLNDNAFALHVRPGARVGDPAILTLSPRVEELTIHNRTRTTEGGEKKLTYTRIPGSKELVVGGVIPLAGPNEKMLLAVDDPALFAANALVDALAKLGVSVTGKAAARHRNPEDAALAGTGVELAWHDSLPLVEALRVVDKESQNLHAEIMLREVSRNAGAIGSRTSGLEELKLFLAEAGIAPKQYNFEDASGLSRLNLVTPASVSRLLVYMYGSKYRDAFVSLLPVAGEDGSLNKRFRDAGRGAIHAKTGSLSHVTALSGYMLPGTGKAYAFSILVNNYNGKTSEVRAVLDKIAVLLMSGS
ncbi:MAG: D-alanyl-D-alanine carboxypeptidase/D-alanyl-D-alanine-endopeptidase [Bryobacteraceae bacterium]